MALQMFLLDAIGSEGKAALRACAHSIAPLAQRRPRVVPGRSRCAAPQRLSEGERRAVERRLIFGAPVREAERAALRLVFVTACVLWVAAGRAGAAQRARMSAAGAAAAAQAEAAQLPVRAHAKLITEAARDNTVLVRAADARSAKSALSPCCWVSQRVAVNVGAECASGA